MSCDKSCDDLLASYDKLGNELLMSCDKSGDALTTSCDIITLASVNRSLSVLSDSPDTPLTTSVAASWMRGRPIS